MRVVSLPVSLLFLDVGRDAVVLEAFGFDDFDDFSDAADVVRLLSPLSLVVNADDDVLPSTFDDFFDRGDPPGIAALRTGLDRPSPLDDLATGDSATAYALSRLDFDRGDLFNVSAGVSISA